ncbi:MAG TPA: DnaB-like helicase N-terminal domain-containing protein, partial [Pseudothermotoga sp.]
MLVHTYKKDERAEKMKELKEKVNFFGFEQTLLSICMKDEEKLIETMTQIKPEYFSSRPNQYIFQTMRILLESKKSIDPAAVYEVLTDEQKKEVDELLGNGLDYIETIYESYSSPKNLQMYIDHVKLAHARRELSIKFDELKDEIMKNESEDLLAYLSKVEGELQEIILKYQTSTDTQSLEDVAERCMEDLITGKKRELGIKTGFDSYDRLTRGLRPNELVIIGARSKMGKSVLSMNWAKQIAKQGKPILYIDTEMTLEEQFFRMLSN